MFWYALVMFVASTVLGELLRPKPKFDTPEPSSLGDFKLPTAQEGRAIPVIWGTCKLSGPNVLWYGGLGVQPITEEVKTGLFSKSTIVTGYRYYLTVHLALCHGMLGDSGSEGVLTSDNFQILFDDRVPSQSFSEVAPSYINVPVRGFGADAVLDASADIRYEKYQASISGEQLFGGQDREGGISGALDIYPGGMWNGPNDHLQAHLGSIPAYLGVAQLVMRNMYVGNSSRIKPVSVIARRCPSPRLFLDGDTTIDQLARIGIDANPAYMILEILLDDVWGLGQPVALMDLDSFYEVALTLKNESLGMSLMLDNPAEAKGFLWDILRHIDGVLYSDPATGLVTLKLARKDYDPYELPVFNESNVLECEFSRGSWTETKNNIKILYIDSSRVEEFDDTILLVHYNGVEGQTSSVDETGNTPPSSIGFIGNAHIDADHPLLGGQAAYLDGSGDVLGVSPAGPQTTFWNDPIGWTLEWAFENDGFTESLGDMWGVITNTDAIALLVYLRGPTHGTPNTIVLQWAESPGVWLSFDAPFVAQDGDMHWCRVTYDGITIRLSLDGTLIGSQVTTISTAVVTGFICGKNPIVGQNNGFYKGWIKELRVTKRVRPSNYDFPIHQFEYPERIGSLGSFVERPVQWQNLANINSRGGEISGEVIKFLGISNSLNANKVAARVGKTLSYPLSTAKLIVNRDGWQLRPGSVLKFTWPHLGVEEMIMRVTRIGYGDLLNGRIMLDLIEDIFGLADTGYTQIPETSWVSPIEEVEAAAFEMLMEIPYHFGVGDDRYIMTLAARENGADLGYQVWSDRDGLTDIEYLQTNTVNQFVPYGELTAALDKCTDALHAAGFSVENGIDLDRLTSVSAVKRDQGRNLALIVGENGQEIVSWQTVAGNGEGDEATITDVVRGVLDTVPLDHEQGAPVWFITDGFGIADETLYPEDITVLVKLLPFNGNSTLAIGAATQLSITLNTRAARPYPPGNVRVNGDPCPEFLVAESALLTWSHRHRVLQLEDNVIPHQDDGDYTDTPEGDYIVDIYVGDVLEHTFTDFADSTDGYSLFYTLEQRNADNTDDSLPVTFTITPINEDGLTGTPRSITFLMLNGPPVANFIGDPLSGEPDLIVDFTDLSTNEPTSWLWEKNNGGGWIEFDGTPTAQHPVETFEIDSNGGTWSVRLTACNAGGCDTETKTDYIEVADADTSLGLFANGFTGSRSNVIDYITIASLGNATDFGDLTAATQYASGAASSTRGVFGGGNTDSSIDYVTIASAGNASTFGNLSVDRDSTASCSSSTRAAFGGGGGAATSNVIDYITIASTGNATDFGDLTQARRNLTAFGSSTRGCFAGGGTNNWGAGFNVIDYITIASTGNATDFGDRTVTMINLGGCSNSTRGIMGGGKVGAMSNVIDYVTIASAGNATDFGDLAATNWGLAACSSPTRGVFGGGDTLLAGGTYSNVLQYVEIATTGNTTDFGDLTVARRHIGATSSGHGGI